MAGSPLDGGSIPNTLGGKVLGRILRLEGGAVAVDFSDAMDYDEIAAIMVAVSDYCKAMDMTPGRLAMRVSALEMARRGAVVHGVPDEHKGAFLG